MCEVHVKRVAVTDLSSYSCNICCFPLLPGEEVPPAGARGQGEEEGSRRGGEEQRVRPEGGGEEYRPHPKMGGEIQGVHWQLPADVWS